MTTTRKYGIIELLTQVGEANVGVQNLDGSIVNAQARSRGATAVTFLTAALTTDDIARGDGKVGLIVWFPPDLLAAARAVLSAPTRPEASELAVDFSRSIPATAGAVSTSAALPATGADDEGLAPYPTFADALAKLPPERQASIRATLAEQQAVMRESLVEESERNRAIREWTTAYYEIEARWTEAAGRLLSLCNCAGETPTMPTYRTEHLPSCPASSAGITALASRPLPATASTATERAELCTDTACIDLGHHLVACVECGSTHTWHRDGCSKLWQPCPSAPASEPETGR